VKNISRKWCSSDSAVSPYQVTIMSSLIKLFVIALVVLAGIAIGHRVSSEALYAPISLQNDEGGTLLVPGQYKAPEWQISRQGTSLESGKVFKVEALELCDSFHGIKNYACQKVVLEWGYEQFLYFDKIIQKESSWNHLAINKESGACGLVQSLPCSKIGNNWQDPQVQIDWGIEYIRDRYGNPKKGWEFHIKNNYY
jgi:hypothetical protein